jgi:hypothetical protein
VLSFGPRIKRSCEGVRKESDALMLMTIAALVSNVQIQYELEKYKVLLQVVSRSTAMLLERGAQDSFSED